MAVKAKDSQAEEPKKGEGSNEQVSNVFDQVGNTPTETKEEKTDQASEPSVPLSEVKTLLSDFKKEMELDFERKLKERLDAERKHTEAKREVAQKQEHGKEVIDDYLEKPVTFFSYHSSYSFHGDMRMGRESLPPGGKIKFKNLIRTRRRGERGVQVISISVANIQSRSQVEFMRTSPLYGIIFHESMDQSLTVDAMWAQKLVEAHQQVGRMSDQDIIARCTVEKINLSTDIQLMRKLLTERVAERSKAQMDMLHAKMAQQVQQMTSTEDGALRSLTQKN